MRRWSMDRVIMVAFLTLPFLMLGTVQSSNNNQRDIVESLRFSQQRSAKQIDTLVADGRKKDAEINLLEMNQESLLDQGNKLFDLLQLVCKVNDPRCQAAVRPSVPTSSGSSSSTSTTTTRAGQAPTTTTTRGPSPTTTTTTCNVNALGVKVGCH